MTLKQMIAEKGNDAIFDADKNKELHRTALWRTWSTSGGMNYFNFIMINPSTANGEIDDRTIKSCIKIAKNNGGDGIIVTNLFTVVETEVKKLFNHKPTNLRYSDDIMREAIELSQRIVCAWGKYDKAGKKNSELMELRSNKVITLVRNMGKIPERLVKNKGDNSPRHPLHVKRDKKFEPFNV